MKKQNNTKSLNKKQIKGTNPAELVFEGLRTNDSEYWKNIYTDELYIVPVDRHFNLKEKFSDRLKHIYKNYEKSTNKRDNKFKIKTK